MDEVDDPVWRLAAGMGAGVAAAGFLPASARASCVIVFGILGVLTHRRYGGAVLLGLALGLLAVRTLGDGPALDGPLALHGTAIGAPTTHQVDIALARVRPLGGAWEEASGRVRVSVRDVPPAPGTEVLVWGDAGPIDRPVLPGDPDPVRNARRTGVHTQVRAIGWAPLGRAPPGPDVYDGVQHGGTLRAIAVGDRRAVDPATDALLRRTGTSHVLSVSGFHVGLLAWAAGGAVAAVLRSAAALSPRGVPLWPAYAAGALAGAWIAWAAGAPSAAQRAAYMTAAAAGAHAVGRRPDPLGLLGLSAIVVLAIDPGAVGTAGFQLSYGAMLGLIRVTPRALAALPAARWPLSHVNEVLAATAGATLGTLPASAWWFQEIAPSAPLANVVALPWISVLVMPPALGAAFLPEPLATACAWLGNLTFDGLVTVLGAMATAPFTIALGPTVAFAATMILVLPRREVAALAALLAITSVQRPPTDPVITFLDVGQGAAAFARLPDGRTFLVDGGRGTGVLRWLRREGVRHVDVVVASHGDADHAQGLLPVMENLHVGQLWLPAVDLGTAPLFVAARVQDTHIELKPPGIVVGHGRSENDTSLVLAIAGVLFAGDLGGAAEDALPLGRLRADGLLVPHHGSKGSARDGLLDGLSPTLAVISAGRRNSYGHPHADVLGRLEARGVPVYRTDRDGTIEVRVTEAAWFVRTHVAGEGYSPEVSIPRDRR